jgi:uncharacterized LabA/DUF88 family protein
MDRVAVFVDAGYLFAQGSRLLSGEKRTRGQVILRHEAMAEALQLFAERVSGAHLLRIYWYDGTSTGPTPQHLTLAHLLNVKVRLGFVNTFGEQKGVDSLIVTDMIALARNRAMCDAVLLSGDEDVRVGVQQAQEFGVRVHLLGIKPCRGSQSLLLMQEADTAHEWVEEDIRGFLSVRPKEEISQATPAIPKPELKPVNPGAATPRSDVAATVFLDLCTVVFKEVPDGEREGLALSVLKGGQIPHDIDAKLLTRAARALGGILEPSQKRTLREAFRRVCEDTPRESA